MTQIAAADLAAKIKPLPGASAAYASAREALLVEEIDLQRRIDSVSAQRRSLPDGPVVEKNYRFNDVNGNEVGLADLFGDKDTLVAYIWMYGPDRARPCPMCTNLLGPLDANAADIEQRVALVVLGRSSLERQLAFAQERGWHALTFAQTVGDDFARDFGGLDPETDEEWAAILVFKKSGTGDAAQVRLFWKSEMTGEMADAGKDPRGGPDFAILWPVLDLTPEGRGDTWYPKLSY